MTSSSNPTTSGLGRRRGALLVGGLAVLLLLVAVSLRRSDGDPLPPPDLELAAGAERSGSLVLGELTWVEVRDRVADGTTTVIVPTGGTEQNGPHLALGKHNVVMAATAELIAEAVGGTLVAPVLAYVPEGDPERGTGHSRWPGTISVPDDVFEEILASTARSMRAAGFTTIVFVGDSGGNQDAQDSVAEDLTRRWRADGVKVVNLDRYYRANGQTEWLVAEGFTEAQIGNHASIKDTSEVWAIDPDLIRSSLRLPDGGADSADSGVVGDPTLASPEIGAVMIDLKVEAGAAQLREILASG